MAGGVGREFEFPAQGGGREFRRQESFAVLRFSRKALVSKRLAVDIRLLFSTMGGAARPSHESTSTAAAAATEIQKNTTNLFDASD
jgi:hypothetical protein